MKLALQCAQPFKDLKPFSGTQAGETINGDTQIFVFMADSKSGGDPTAYRGPAPWQLNINPPFPARGMDIQMPWGTIIFLKTTR